MKTKAFIIIIACLGFMAVATDYKWTGTSTVKSIQPEWHNTGLLIDMVNGKNIFLKFSDIPDENLLKYYFSTLLMATNGSIKITVRYIDDLNEAETYDGKTYYKIHQIKVVAD